MLCFAAMGLRLVDQQVGCAIRRSATYEMTRNIGNTNGIGHLDPTFAAMGLWLIDCTG